jgi:small nuclear ribonucleoprotein G
MGVQVPELKQCVLQSFHFIVLSSSSSLSSLLVLLLFREILLSLAPSKMRFGFAMTISLPRFSLLFLAPNETPSDEAKRSSHHHHHHHHLLNNRYMDKKLKLKLNGNRGVIGILRGFDQFLNLVLDECVNDSTAEKTPLGMVVVRGASVLSMEALEHIAPVQRKSVM